MEQQGVTEGERTNERGQKLYTVTYRARGEQRAVYVHSHGYGEHVGRMQHYFSTLAAAGITVYSFDHYGHGKSEPHTKKGRAFIRKFSDLVDDIDALAKEAAATEPAGTPFFIGGQSMGGLVALHTALRASLPWQGIVLTSALVDFEWTPVLRFQAKIGNILATLVPHALLVPGVDPNNLCPDPVVVKDYVEDPLNFVGKTRTRTANELLKATRELGPQKTALKLPIFAAHGTVDKTTSFKAVQGLLDSCSSTDKTLKVVEGGYHELLLGPEKDEVISAVRDWILAHAAAAPSKL